MSAAQLVHAELISGTTGLRAHKSVLPRERTLPAIVITPIAGSDEIHLRGDSGLTRQVVQLDAWASLESGAESYMEQAKQKMLNASTFQVANISVSGADTYDEEANLYRASREFTIWFNQ